MEAAAFAFSGKNRYICIMNIFRTLIFAAVVGLGAPVAVGQGFAVDARPVSSVTGTASDSPSKSELLRRLRRWVALTFDRSDVVDLLDADNCTVVLKWSAPLTQPSQWITASLGETCVIDMRDGGRWRLQVYAPRISWAVSETASMLDEMGMTNEEAAADTRLIGGLAQRVYGGSMDWPADETLDKVVAAYLEQLDGTQQFRNDRDRERGRATDEYRAAERQWHILNDVRRGAEQYNTSLVQSLSRALSLPADF